MFCFGRCRVYDLAIIKPPDKLQGSYRITDSYFKKELLQNYIGVNSKQYAGNMINDVDRQTLTFRFCPSKSCNQSCFELRSLHIVMLLLASNEDTAE
eukprot:6183041-Pleurochrysis_carterae.AAC.1